MLCDLPLRRSSADTERTINVVPKAKDHTDFEALAAWANAMQLAMHIVVISLHRDIKPANIMVGPLVTVVHGWTAKGHRFNRSREIHDDAKRPTNNMMWLPLRVSGKMIELPRLCKPRNNSKAMPNDPLSDLIFMGLVRLSLCSNGRSA